MSRPTWATVVGILGIILACLGIFGAGQTMLTPVMMKFQKEMMAGMQHSMRQQSAAHPQQAPPPEMFNAMQKMWNLPSWYGPWCVGVG